MIPASVTIGTHPASLPVRGQLATSERQDGDVGPDRRRDVIVRDEP